MEHISRVIIIILSNLILSCSHKQRTIDVSPKEANLHSLTTYRNIYNKYEKLEVIFIDEKSFSTAGSSSSKELHFTYKNDTILLKEEKYNILPDGSKILTSYCMYDETSEKYME